LGGLDVPHRAVIRPFACRTTSKGALATPDSSRSARTWSSTIVFGTEDEWWEWKWSYSIRGVLEQIDASREASRRAAFDALQPLRQPEGFPMRLTACFAFGRKRS
jgi:hypothetical protein